MDALRLVDLEKSFGQVRAVDRISLEVGQGELLSLLGPSGCGKTTTLRMLAGFETPDSGEIYKAGSRISSASAVVPPERRGMSMIFQSYAIWPHMTVYQNVEYGLRLRNVDAGERDRRVREVLGAVRMEALAERYSSELSGGQQQRVSLARALIVRPDVLLMDEPLSNLDASLREELRLEIGRLHYEFGLTIVYVTHDLTEAMVVSDRIAVLQDGKLAQLGTPEEIYERPATMFVASFMGHMNLLEASSDGNGHIIADHAPLRAPKTTIALQGDGELWKIGFRPHDATVVTAGESSGSAGVRLGGVVIQNVYLGLYRELVVRLDGSGVLVRLLCDRHARHDRGEAVDVLVPPDRCLAISHTSSVESSVSP